MKVTVNHQYDIFPSEILVDLEKAISDSSKPNISLDRLREVFMLDKKRIKAKDNQFTIPPSLRTGSFLVWFSLRLATDPGWRIQLRLDHFYQKVYRKDYVLKWLESHILDKIHSFNLVDCENKIQVIVDWIARKKREESTPTLTFNSPAIKVKGQSGIQNQKNKSLEKEVISKIIITSTGQKKLEDELRKKIKKYRHSSENWLDFDSNNDGNIELLRAILKGESKDVTFLYNGTHTELGYFFHYESIGLNAIFQQPKTIVAKWIERYFYHISKEGLEVKSKSRYMLSCLYGKQSNKKK